MLSIKCRKLKNWQQSEDMYVSRIDNYKQDIFKGRSFDKDVEIVTLIN